MPRQRALPFLLSDSQKIRVARVSLITKYVCVDEIESRENKSEASIVRVCVRVCVHACACCQVKTARFAPVDIEISLSISLSNLSTPVSLSHLTVMAPPPGYVAA